MHRSVIVLAAIGLPATAALAGGDGDIAIALRGGQIITGIGDHDFYPNDREFPERVFGADFENLGGGNIVGEEPGWLGPFADIDPLNDPFPTAATLGFDILDRLLVWNGASTVAGGDFGDTTNTMRIFDTSPGSPEVFTPATTETVEGFTVVADTSDGIGFDEHPFYQLVNDEPGVFLLNVRITTNDPSILPSEPIWLVFNNGVDEDIHDAAIEYVEDVIVPAPAGAAVLAMGGLLAARRRR